ncbi:MAG: hypothetical protein LAT82_03080 [Nanoarchaeota archaeon]|nr:hypothetical protein [Nanoarchaeota archaeon]
MNQDVNTNFKVEEEKIIIISYTNWKGITSQRRIIPQNILFSSNEYHPEKQWLIEAYDVDKNAMRTFACRDIHSWK